MRQFRAVFALKFQDKNCIIFGFEKVATSWVFDFPFDELPCDELVYRPIR